MADVQELVLHYKQTGCIETRNEIMVRFLPFVYKTSRKIKEVFNRIQYDDIVSCCTICLINSIEYYKINRSSSLMNYLYRYLYYRCIQYMEKDIIDKGTIKGSFKDIFSFCLDSNLDSPDDDFSLIGIHGFASKDEIESKDIYIDFHDIIKILPYEKRLAVTMAMEGCKNWEIAKALNRNSVGDISNYLKAIYRSLRKSLLEKSYF